MSKIKETTHSNAPPGTEELNNTTTQSTATTRKQKIEEAIGDTVNGMSSEWARTLMKQGVIVKLEIHRWRPYVRLDADELGISRDDPQYRQFIDTYVTLGRKKLLPPEIINEVERCESAAREALKRYSYDTLWGRFVPCTAYRRLKQELEIQRSIYYDLRDQLVMNLADYRTEMQRQYRVAGIKAWQQINGKDEMTSDDKAQAERFAEDLCDRVLSRIPDAETIKQSFYFAVTPYHIPLPSEFEQDLLQEARARDERDVEAHRQRLLIEMNREVADHYREKKTEMIDGFLKAVVGQMGSLVHEVAVNVQASIEKNNGHLIGRSALQLKNLIERVEVLNFMDDARIETEIASIKEQLDRAADDRDIVEISEILRRIRDIAAHDLIALNDPARTRRTAPDTNVTVEPLRREARPEIKGQDVAVVTEGSRRTRRRSKVQEIVTAEAA